MNNHTRERFKTNRLPRFAALGAAAVALLSASALVPALGLASDSTGIATPITASAAPVDVVFTNAFSEFQVRGYRVKGDSLLTNAIFTSVLDHQGQTNASLVEIVSAAAELQHQYLEGGYTNVTIAIGRDQITNGTVVVNVFRGLVPQIVVDGRRCAPAQAAGVSASDAPSARAPTTLANARPSTPSTVAAREAKAASTNAPPGFLVRAYQVNGDTLLNPVKVQAIMSKYTGKNVTVADIIKAGSDLQLEYRNRGFVTAKVVIPPQKLDSNAVVNIQVLEGTLAEVNVINNHHFSSNNIMRSLPSLHTNMILVAPVFQAELDRANANQDRQIYPIVGPGPTEGTTTLDLKVTDRLPLHAKVEFNNQNSPGTPDLRLNSSMIYNNLWQQEHSAGVQYSFSPTDYKTGDRWNFYDLPLVANYGGFYRLPLGDPSPIAAAVANKPGSFGYDEATRQFRLPPPSGQAELNFFASRSTIDTGLMTLGTTRLSSTNGNTLDRQDVQQDLTVNNDVGLRLSIPLASTARFQSGFSAGGDYKNYELTSVKSNLFIYTTLQVDTGSGSPIPRTNIYVQTFPSPVPTTVRSLDYLPLSLRYNASLRDNLGVTTVGLGLNLNAWYSGSVGDLRNITGSSESSGHWVILNPTLSRDFILCTNWVLSLNASGQWADEPLISNEQFGIGGIGSVRGYHEGEVFGNSGWWVTAEQKTPAYVIGRVHGNKALSVRGSVFMGYGEAFSLAPSSPQDLWGTGFGGIASIGSAWEARFLFSWPLIRTSFTEPGQARFDFSLSAQF